MWTKLQVPIHIFCNYKCDTIDYFYHLKWEAKGKGGIIVKSSLRSSETYIYSNWDITFLKSRFFFLLRTMNSKTKVLYTLKKSYVSAVILA